MASYNKVILMGHLTRDLENGQLPSGTSVCEFGLAVNRQWKDAQGQKKEEVLFIDCTAFGKVGETIGTHLAKGRAIHVEGHLKLDSWEAQDGSKRSKVRVIVEQFRFVDGRGKEAGAKGTTGAPAESAGNNGVNGSKGRGGRTGTSGGKIKRPAANGNGSAIPGPLVEAGTGAAAKNAGNPNSRDIPF